MGLRCLLGHEYANREVEREREERGNEVVVTYRTVETCERCGERRTVSENKEVRPVRNPRDDEVTTGLGGGVTADLGESEEAADAPATDAEPTEDGETTTDAPSEAADGESAPDPAVADADADVTDTTDDVDDAIILDDGPAEAGNGRGRGEWPDADAETAADAEAPDGAEAVDDADEMDDGATVVSGDEGWPDTDGEDEGYDAEPSDGGPSDVSFGGGLTPERAEEAANGEAGTAAANGTADGAGGTAGGSVAGKQFVAAEEVERVGEESDGETEFFCPNCGYARVAGGSSMRAGDICPDCHKGYIAERDR